MRGLRLIGLLLCSTSAFAGTVFNLSGTFNTDDQLQLFYYSVANTALVSISTTSFATGGFSPVLTVFDSTGAFQFDNQGYGTNTDATLSWNSLAGMKYLVVLTQYDNVSPGPGYNFSDGFSEQGNGNFTADLPFNLPTPGGSFLLPGGEQRTNQWAVTFSSDEETLTLVPEPGTVGLWLGGITLLAAWKRRTIHRF